PPYQGAATPAIGTVASTSGTSLPCGLALVVVSHSLARGLGYGLPMGGRPCMGAGRGWPSLFAAFIVKT
ncbi:hypothetical protein B296_00019528, partial [Ensete ventricosum]